MRRKENLQPPPWCPRFWEALHSAIMSFTFKRINSWLVASLNSTRRTSFQALEAYNMRGRSHGGHTWGNCMTGLRAGKGALLWISVKGLLEHGVNHQRITGVKRSHGLWRLFHSTRSCNGLVIWKTSRAKYYGSEFEKLNHNETLSWPTVLQWFGYIENVKGKGLWTRIWKVKS